MSLTCFKAYRLRGHVPDELNPDIACRQWRFDQRGSNTGSALRIGVEARGDASPMPCRSEEPSGVAA